MITLKTVRCLYFTQLLSVYPTLILGASLSFSIPYPCWSKKVNPSFCLPHLPYLYLFQDCLALVHLSGQEPGA